MATNNKISIAFLCKFDIMKPIFLWEVPENGDLYLGYRLRRIGAAGAGNGARPDHCFCGQLSRRRGISGKTGSAAAAAHCGRLRSSDHHSPARRCHRAKMPGAGNPGGKVPVSEKQQFPHQPQLGMPPLSSLHSRLSTLVSPLSSFNSQLLHPLNSIIRK